MQKTNVKKDILWRVYLSLLFVCLFGILILVRVFRLQVVERDRWESLADSLLVGYQTIEASRGNIYATDGSLLATSVPVYEVRMDMMATEKKVFDASVDSLGLFLSREFRDKPASEYTRLLRQARNRKERYFLIKRKLNFEQVKRMRDWPLLRLGKYKGGLVVIEKDRREKPFQLLAERTIGYSVAGVAPVGLEGSFDKELAGVSGKRLMQKVSGGVWVPVNDEYEVEPEDGRDIYTTIDINLQDVAENALMRALQEHDAHHGCAVLMEVKTGEIRAIANLMRKSPGVYTEEYNYAVGESAEPGSTFKLASMIALLEDKLVTLDDTVNINYGVTRYFDRDMQDAEPGHFAKLSVKGCFEHSSNVGISRLVYKNYSKDPEKFVAHLRSLMLDTMMGLQMTGEGKPRIKHPSDKDWYGTTLPWVSIGYESSITPLQTLTLYNAVANNGKMVKPLFVKEIRKAGKLEQRFKTHVMKEEICSQETLKKLREMMLGVVENGTAKNLKNLDYKVAGKTGTAQVADASRGYKQKVYKSSFVGYFPADDPQYTCIVVINAPSKGIYYGSAVAGPVFREIADKVYSGMMDVKNPELHVDNPVEGYNIPVVKSGDRDDIKTVLSRLAISSHTMQRDSDEYVQWVHAERNDQSVSLKEKNISPYLVPDVVGMGLKDALYLMENRGLKVNVRGYGKVTGQSVMPGSRIIKGSTITLTLG